jgi:hypothetical protein
MQASDVIITFYYNFTETVEKREQLELIKCGYQYLNYSNKEEMKQKEID